MTDENIIIHLSRDEAVSLGLKQYENLRPCIRGHTVRYVNGDGCAECHRLRSKSQPKKPRLFPKVARERISVGHRHYYYSKPCAHRIIPEGVIVTSPCEECVALRKKRSLQKVREWRERNKEYCKFFNKIRYYKDRDKNLKEKRDYRLNNIEKVRELGSINRKKHRARIIAANKKRKHELSMRIPSWANLKVIEDIYKLREKISRETGIEHHVDHIIPLKGKNVSGLHVETNLQVIPAVDNLVKKNKFDSE